MSAPQARSVARRSNAKAVPVDEAKRRVLDMISQGHKVADACASVNRKVATYEDWRKTDPAFAAELRALRETVATAKETGRQPVPDFETFCREWLNAPLFPHQLRMLDVIEGREPRDMHPSMLHEPGDRTRVLINLPPSHGKTQTFSIHYPLWRILKDPDVKIVVISKSQGLARQILGAVKHRLTSPAFARMQLAFGPEGGFKDSESSWTQTEIYVAGRGESAGTLLAKDPTMQAIGLGGQLYGARSDVIILDDGVTLSNVAQHQHQMAWLRQEADTRLPPDGGLLLVLGTRVAPVDLYREIRAIEDLDGGQYFTYLAQPAVLEYADRREDWDTLWPQELTQDGQLLDRWTGPRLAKKRAAVGERTWALVYQQLDVIEDATFNQRAVEASVNGMRLVGPLKEHATGHERGMAGLYVILGVDPAAAGCTAMIVMAVDKQTQKRYILDGFNRANTSSPTLYEQMKHFVETYNVSEVIIESNAYQKAITQNLEFRQFLFQRGCKLTPHMTTGNKSDPDFGVMSMAQLFESCGQPPERNIGGPWKKTPDRALIELPSTKQTSWVQELASQLITWQPSGMAQSAKTDLVMALWFCTLAAYKVLGIGKSKPGHLQNGWLTGAQRARRQVVNLAEWREAREAEDADDGVDVGTGFGAAFRTRARR